MAGEQCQQCKIIASMRAFIDNCTPEEAYDSLHRELHGPEEGEAESHSSTS